MITQLRNAKARLDYGLAAAMNWLHDGDPSLATIERVLQVLAEAPVPDYIHVPSCAALVVVTLARCWTSVSQPIELVT